MVHTHFLGWFEQTGLLGPNHSLNPYQRIDVKCPNNVGFGFGHNVPRPDPELPVGPPTYDLGPGCMTIPIPEINHMHSICTPGLSPTYMH